MEYTKLGTADLTCEYCGFTDPDVEGGMGIDYGEYQKLRPTLCEDFKACMERREKQTNDY